MKIQYENFYNVVFTLIIAFAIIWLIYISVPYSHYSLYLIETKNKN
jgi:hypothetical protein